MHVLFLHDAFPAQFGRLGLELTRRHGWRCSYLVQQLSSCPTPSREMLESLEIHQLPLSADHRSSEGIPWPQIFGAYLEQCATVAEALRARPGLRPDLVVAHGGRGAPTLFLRDHVDAPLVVYCEYYFATSHRDISYRIDLPPAEPAPFFPRCINAPTLAALVDCDAGYSATRWQRDSFPDRFRPKIEPLFDGIDTELYRPGPPPQTLPIGGKDVAIPSETKVVTFVSRGLESIRGFDLFMEVASRILRERSDVLFVVVGGEEIHYGWDRLHTGSPSFKQWVLGRGDYDLSRFLFTGRILPEHLAEILRRSDLHIYLTAPFVVSWSLFNAMATGLPVLASDVAPVREVVESGVNGLLEPLFDVDRLAATALEVLARPADFEGIRRQARRTIEERYSLDACIPPIKGFLERVASGRGAG
ncbi:D-inositol-3-phosphate glycosyltransferase [Aquisphaera giovannonii]|uniref:D-inositol-3-phosphate glycosyltransferase n=1 Tax=Aquisphaera giovannonii TaxID=406548 RepID=A0A5B9W2P3_9BACT|nr:glycosyltransferase [Aquisphaera giovannonii]QEH34569.1 D-inositol-3-phosphate glycosyltransferase [Aquisphaera giovannonii]